MPGAHRTEHEHIGTCSEATLRLLLDNIKNILENFKTSLLNDLNGDDSFLKLFKGCAVDLFKERSGAVRQLKDEELKKTVLEVSGSNVATTFILSPPPLYDSLGLRLPCLTLHLKYFDQPFSFEVQVLDDEGMKRRFRFSTYHTETKVSTFLTTMGLALVPGWNIVQLSLAEFTRRAYRSLYLETLRIQVHASCRLRKIYFSDNLYDDHDLPNDYKLCLTGTTR